jgi:predicted metalloprotease
MAWSITGRGNVSRSLALVVTIVLLAAACGDGGGVTMPTTAPETTESPTTTAPEGTIAPDTTVSSDPVLAPDASAPALENGYPQGLVDAYMDGCTEDGDATFCRCTIVEFQELMSLDEFVALGQGDPTASDVVLDVTEFCLAETGQLEEPVTVGDGVSIALDLDQLVALTQDDLVAFWGTTLPDLYGIAYEDLAAVIPYFVSQGDLPQCGPDPLPIEAYQENAFYCHPGDFIAWDAEVLLPGLYTEFGDFSVALVLAHEWAHAVQARALVNGPTIMTELQADCFAGVWAGAVDAGESEVLVLEPGDLDEAMAGYLLFRDPPGTDPGGPQAHGSAFDRVNAFQDGFSNGPVKCRAYEQGEFLVVDIPLTEEDLQTGGDLPFADVAPLVIDALERYWSLLYPQLFGTDYVPMTNFGPYVPSTGLLPPCGPGEPDPDDYVGNAFYCPEGDFVAWDNENLFPALYQRIGDFAIGMVLAHEWATGVQARAGFPTEGLIAELQADCLTGVWTADMVPFDNPMDLVLSAGDLDEGVAGFLAFGDDPATGEPRGGTAFQRFNAFQDGFFNGAAQCLTYSG